MGSGSSMGWQRLQIIFFSAQFSLISPNNAHEISKMLIWMELDEVVQEHESVLSGEHRMVVIFVAIIR